MIDVVTQDPDVNVVTTTFAPDRVYRPREVVALGHLPREMVYAALRTGELVAVRRGRGWLIPGASISAWIASLGS